MKDADNASKFAPPPIGHNLDANPALEESVSQFSQDLLADTDLNFDPQAFFNDYMFTGKTHHFRFLAFAWLRSNSELANQNGYGHGPTNYGDIGQSYSHSS